MISTNQINQITALIIQHIDPEKIILFGSYAFGTQTEESDVDLLIVVNDANDPPFKRARAIRQLLWGITGKPKDILVYTQREIDEWQNVEQAFITTAVRTGRVIYENKKGSYGGNLT